MCAPVRQLWPVGMDILETRESTTQLVRWWIAARLHITPLTPNINYVHCAEFLRQFSCSDSQQVKMQAPWSCTAAVPSCCHSSANFFPQSRAFSSFSCISMPSVFSQLKCDRSGWWIKLSGLIRKENSGPYSWKYWMRIANSVSSPRMYPCISVMLILHWPESSFAVAERGCFNIAWKNSQLLNESFTCLVNV